MIDEKNQQQNSSLLGIIILAMFVLAMCAGCSTTVPVTAKFPEPPGKQASVKCPNLQKLKDEAKLSDVAETVTLNYTTYYECAIKNDAWIEWYNVQKNIFEGLVK
jgi:flagellar basal body-associated protein FliL